MIKSIDSALGFAMIKEKLFMKIKQVPKSKICNGIDCITIIPLDSHDLCFKCEKFNEILIKDMWIKLADLPKCPMHKMLGLSLAKLESWKDEIEEYKKTLNKKE